MLPPKLWSSWKTACFTPFLWPAPAPVAAVRAMAAAGADLVELGIPFSDPTAEGPVIQEANLRALTAGTTTDKVFDLVRDLRRDVTIPFVFMTYANVVFSYGAERFLSTCAEIGVDGLILPDLPFEEKEEFLPLCRQCGWCHCGFGHREADDPIRQRGPGPRGRICAPDEAGPVTFRLSRSVPFPHGGHSDPISKKNKCKARPRTALLCGSGPGCFFLMSSYGQRVLRSICSLNASSRVASWAGFHSAGSAWSALNAATGTPSSALRRRSTSGSVPHQGRQLRL